MTTTPPNTQRGLLASNVGTRSGMGKRASGVADPLADTPSAPPVSLGLIHNWRFNESGTSPASDLAGGETLAHTNGFAGWGTGHVPPSYWAMQTAAANNSTLASATFDWIPTGDFSIVTWFQLQGGSNYSYIFRALRADNTHRLDLSYSPFVPGFLFRGRFAHLNREVNAASTNTNGRWYFIHAQFIQSTKTMRLRVQDPLVSHDTGWQQYINVLLDVNSDPSTAATPFVVGGADGNNVQQDAKVDQLSIWDRALTDEEHDYLYASGVGVEL